MLQARRAILFLALTSLAFVGACHHPRVRPAPRPEGAIASASERIQRLRLALFDGGHPDWDLVHIEAGQNVLLIASPENRIVDLDLALEIAREDETLGRVRLAGAR